MERKGILKAISKMLKKPKYYTVSLKVPSVEENLAIFNNVLNSINYESIIPNMENSLTKNLSLLTKSISEPHTIIVKEEDGELKEIMTGFTITYKAKNNESVEVHPGLSGLAYVEVNEMNSIDEEEVEDYKKVMSQAFMQDYLNKVIMKANGNYKKIMIELEKKLKRKNRMLRG